ncbi:hypothetical protein [Aurantibacillus circumpalustris]|uniref:hypothetical protein n=1 Tax=Aurantibacillus circumpalustris TaxID=3036359 RepID=UPI00295BB593|nr:hypothetical protein [Aurantibacillus circumpalustris]
MKSILILFYSIATFALCGGTESKIVFSNKPIDVSSGESLAEATFDLGDIIYCRVYLPKNLNEYTIYKDDDSPFYWVDVTLKDKEYTEVYKYKFNTVEEANISTFEFVLTNGKSSIARTSFIDSINSAGEGKLLIKIEIFATGKISLAVGEFTLNKSKNSVMGIGKDFNSILAKNNEPILEARAIEALIEYFNISRAIQNNKRTPLKVKIVSDWEITNAPTGEITGRIMDFAVLHRIEYDGHCSVKVYRLQQKYTGEVYEDNFMSTAGHVIVAGSNYSEYIWDYADCN